MAIHGRSFPARQPKLGPYWFGAGAPPQPPLFNGLIVPEKSSRVIRRMQFRHVFGPYIPVQFQPPAGPIFTGLAVLAKAKGIQPGRPRSKNILPPPIVAPAPPLISPLAYKGLFVRPTRRGTVTRNAFHVRLSAFRAVPAGAFVGHS